MSLLDREPIAKLTGWFLALVVLVISSPVWVSALAAVAGAMLVLFGLVLKAANWFEDGSWTRVVSLCADMLGGDPDVCRVSYYQPHGAWWVHDTVMNGEAYVAGFVLIGVGIVGAAFGWVLLSGIGELFSGLFSKPDS